MRYFTICSAVAAPVLGYSIASGVGAGIPAYPACSLYTLYYKDVVELASATSTFFSSMASCSVSSAASASNSLSSTGVSSTASISTFMSSATLSSSSLFSSSVSTSALSSTTSPSSTSSVAAQATGPCIYTSDKTYIRNPSFECNDINSGAWYVGGRDQFNNPLATIIAQNGVIPAHSGTNILQLASGVDSHTPNINQTITTPNGMLVDVTFYARLATGDTNLSGCYFGGAGGASSQTGFYSYTAHPGNPPTTIWQAFTFQYVSQGTDTIEIYWDSCSGSSPTKLYVDDFSYLVST